MAEDLDGVAERPPGPAYHTLAALPSPARLGPWDASHSPRTPEGAPRRYAGFARKNKTRKDCRQRVAWDGIRMAPDVVGDEVSVQLETQLEALEEKGASWASCLGPIIVLLARRVCADDSIVGGLGLVQSVIQQNGFAACRAREGAELDAMCRHP